MAYREKSAWVMVLAVVGVYGWYFAEVIPGAVGVDVTDIDYRERLFFTVIFLVLAAIAGHVVAALADPDETDVADERDREINRFGEYIGGFVLGVTAVAAVLMAAYEVPHFWIANAVLFGMVVSEIVSNITQIVAYRRGF